ncbi:MAG TPA: folate family ECF transporter S component [Firmicutes bacterium]|nr:folate family ECF transporter S component [Candidatus Fermentithermobacillaceae bacterium]
MARTRSLVMTGLLAGLSVILTRFASFRLVIGNVEAIRIGFGALPNIMAGIILGPKYGAIAGAVSDVVGFFLSPMGLGYMPHFTLCAALMGAIPGIVFSFLNRNEEKANPPHSYLLIAVFSGIALVSCGLTPYFLHLLYGIDYRIIMPPRIISGAIEIAIYSYVLKFVYAPVAKFALGVGGSSSQ